jgi:hypothetical protein
VAEEALPELDFNIPLDDEKVNDDPWGRRRAGANGNLLMHNSESARHAANEFQLQRRQEEFEASLAAMGTRKEAEEFVWREYVKLVPLAFRTLRATLYCGKQAPREKAALEVLSKVVPKPAQTVVGDPDRPVTIVFDSPIIRRIQEAHLAEQGGQPALPA